MFYLCRSQKTYEQTKSADIILAHFWQINAIYFFAENSISINDE